MRKNKLQRHIQKFLNAYTKWARLMGIKTPLYSSTEWNHQDFFYYVSTPFNTGTAPWENEYDTEYPLDEEDFDSYDDEGKPSWFFGTL